MGGICKLFDAWWLCRQDVKIYCKALQFGISLQLDLIKVHIITMQILGNVCTESIESPVQGGPGKSSRLESRIWSRAILNRTRDSLPWVPMTWPFFCAPSPLDLDFDGWINKIDVNGKAKAWPNMTKVLFWGGGQTLFYFCIYGLRIVQRIECKMQFEARSTWVRLVVRRKRSDGRTMSELACRPAHNFLFIAKSNKPGGSTTLLVT